MSYISSHFSTSNPPYSCSQPACLSVCLLICLSPFLCTCLPIDLLACLPLCLSVCPLACLHVYVLTCLPACLSPCLPACLPVSLPACLPACLPVSLPACLPACLSASPLTVIISVASPPCQPPPSPHISSESYPKKTAKSNKCQSSSIKQKVGLLRGSEETGALFSLFCQSLEFYSV